MNELECSVCRDLIQGYLDLELDAPTREQVSRHLASCAGCASRYERALQLSVAVRSMAPYHRAPAALVQHLFEPLATQAQPEGFLYGLRESARRWWAPVFSAVTLSLALLLYIAAPSAEQPWLDEAVSSHVRSLMVEHLNDVESSERHTVKPWFTGRLDFAPPVSDYSAQGFPLLGGRLDYLQHQTAAALAYRHDRHTINLFILPTDEVDQARQSQSLRGYNVVSWRRDHLRFILVSDLEKTRLEAFGQLIEKGAP